MERVLQWIFHFYESAVFTYGTILMLIYALLGIFSFLAIRRFLKKESYTNYGNLLTSPLAPGISVLAPVFNNGLSVITSVRSLLTLNYPVFEIILINDGSTDNSLEQLVLEFDLVPVDFAFAAGIPTQPVKHIYKSSNPAFGKLIVVDKVNGGNKADAANAGINVASFRYFVCTDINTILDKDTLLKLMKPVLEENAKRVIAVGATLRVANSCDIDNGVMLRMRPPRQWLPRFQEMEYIRAFMLNRMGWGYINCVPNISGGLGLFDKEMAVQSGGYEQDAFDADMALMLQMIRYSCENNITYAIRYVPATLCWTEAPVTVSTFGKQRTLWARGSAQLMCEHIRMLFNPRYGRVGLLMFPYNLCFELLLPLVELSGLVYFAILAATGNINYQFALFVFLYLYFFGIVITTIAVLWDQMAFRHYRTWKEVIGLCCTSFFEVVLYHPLIVLFSLKGYYYFLTGKKTDLRDIS